MGSSLELPTVLTPEIQHRIIELLTEGNYPKVAAVAAGTTYQAFRWWQKRWEAGDPEAQRFDQFFRDVARAVPIGETAALRRIHGGNLGWQSSAWFLERRFSQRWGKQDRSPIPPVPRDLSKLSDEDLERHRQEQERRTARTG